MSGRLASCSTPRRSRGSCAYSTTPDLAAGRRGLLRSLASGMALSPSTTWVPPSSRLAHHLDEYRSDREPFIDVVNNRSAKSGQDQSIEEVRTLREARKHVPELAFWPVTYYLRCAAINVANWSKASQAITEHGAGIEFDAAGAGSVSDAIAIASVGNFHHLAILAYRLAAKGFIALREMRARKGAVPSTIAQAERGVMLLSALVGHAEQSDLAAIKGIEADLLAFVASSPFQAPKAKQPASRQASRARGKSKGRHHG